MTSPPIAIVIFQLITIVEVFPSLLVLRFQSMLYQTYVVASWIHASEGVCVDIKIEQNLEHYQDVEFR